MKKSLFFVAAASALMLTACSSENDVLQSATPSQPVVQQAVGFNVYTPAATGVTRAGLEGTMTTGRLQRSETDGGGFGVYAYLTEDVNGTAGTSEASPYATSYEPISGQQPNFMVNEKILWNSENLGWYYNPLKYWPNETDNDSQATPASMEGASPVHLDRLTFFAYAPYVSAGAAPTGITAISDNAGKLNSTAVTDPTVAWKGYSTNTNINLEEGVDLLWGVAPSGGLSYTAVNGWTVKRDEGKPLINMIKPDVNTSMKFLFNHALARFGLTVVAAVDQVSPGGKLDPNTKITINSVKISGPFGNTGELNLNNRDYANIAYWTKIKDVAIVDNNTHTGTAAELTLTGGTAASDEDNAIAPNLRWAGDHTFGSYSKQNVVGVTTAKQDLLRPSKQWLSKLSSAPAYNPAKVYYTDATGNTKAVAKYKTTQKGEVYTKDGSGNLVVVAKDEVIDAPAYPYYDKDGESTYYTVTVDKTYPANYPNGENSYSNLRYKFESYGDVGCTIPYGNGVVEVVAVGTSKTKVKVLENDANTAYVGQEFWVNGTTFTPNATYRLQQPSNTPLDIWVKVIQEVKYGYNDTNLPKDYVLYKVNGTGTAEDPTWYEYAGTKKQITWDKNTNTYVTLNASNINVNDLDYKYDASGTYYEAERNYIYVVPTNIIKTRNGALTPTEEQALRTITLQIEYYITTEDNKVAGGRTQTKNVITKDVVLPSLANGKSYNLNLVLGLTSVKVEAEVDDWKVENVQADLPQNTAE